ncbi:MAG: chemotaxis protein CheW [Nanobdellota archaeon]
MDMSEYKKEFISEAREHLDNINEGLLVLEKDSSDQDNIHKLFRGFHTLKGNSATMGFMKFSELAHSLEDVLSKIRDKELKPASDVLDKIFEGCDVLESGLEEIENGKSENLDAEGIISDLKELLGNEKEDVDVKINEKAQLTKKEKTDVNKLKKKKMNIFRIILIFDSENVLKTAKSLVIIRDLNNIGEFIRLNPKHAEIKKGNFESEIEVIFGSKKKKEEVESVIKKVSGIKEVYTLGLDESYKRSDDSVHEDKEQSKSKIADKHKSSAVKQVQSVKVEMNKLDKLVNLVGELLISNMRLQDIDKKKTYDHLRGVVSGIDRLSTELQDEVMEIRMVPIGNIFKRFPRMVRDLAKKEGKKVDLQIEGQEIEFDRTVLDEIGDPLVHLLRNSIDHGIETPDERINVGKSEQGTLKLVASREKNNAVVEVIDDGAGIDPQKVKKSFIKKGIITEEEAKDMTDKQLQMLIFRAGGSTSEKVTDVSGRGVGMDVVANKVKQLGGSFNLDSTPGKGTSIKIKLPLTVAIISAMLVKISNSVYALPLNAVERIMDIKLSDVKTIKGNEVYILDGREIPLLWLHELVGEGDFEKKEDNTVVIVNRDGEKVGLVVDSVVGQQQILIKALQEIVKGTKGLSGATILGDGTVALILDLGSLW